MTTFGNMGPLSKAVYLVNLGAVLMVCGTNMVAPYPPAKSVEMAIELDKSPLTILVEEQTHFLSREHEDHTIAERQEVAENDHAGTTLEDARRLAENRQGEQRDPRGLPARGRGAHRTARDARAG